MSKLPTVVLAWELGHGLGHLYNLRCIAVELVKSEFNVVLITKNIETARIVFWGVDVTVSASPHIETSAPQWLVVEDGIGYVDLRSNSGAVDQWGAIFNEYKPVLVVFESSPIALYASDDFNFIKIQVGTGWFDYIKLVDRSQDKTVVSDDAFLTVYRELDPYAELRDKKNYLGPLSFLSELKAKVSNENIDVLVYLTDPVLVVHVIIPALRLLGLQAKIHCPGILVGGLELPQCVSIEKSPICFETYMPHAKLLICHGNANSVCAALHCGVPCLMIPSQCEQAFIASKVSSIGAGVSMSAASSSIFCKELMSLLIHSRSTADQVAQFSKRYDDNVIHDFFCRVSSR